MTAAVQTFPLIGAGTTASALSEYVNDATPTGLAAGSVRFTDFNRDFQVWYDEVLFCHSTTGRFAIVVEGVTHELAAGDTIFIPAQTKLTYISEGTTHLFYAVSPANWQALRP